MSRVLLVSSVLAVLPIPAGASSIVTLPAISGPAPSIISLGTPAKNPPSKPVRDVNKGVTPMVMRGGIPGGASSAPAVAAPTPPAADPAAEAEPEIVEEAAPEEAPAQD